MFYLHAADLHLQNIDVTLMLVLDHSDSSWHLSLIYMLQKNVSSRYRDKGKVPVGAGIHQGPELGKDKRIDRLQFGLERIESYYLPFREKRTITEEA
ncbi:hypothetical protein HAX54_035910 [Datura stramonium]|uniref:Uncharacterized protein n=1 Tax=Datura stramonium TaxID=4076 RepID=A0ABS8VJ04_DATST|nr:hypothetical protein [Datura stramonium]